ncbi:lipopolysaccharide biosynthesis protein [Acinetobacter haemolyticus]|uniref:lipopolysaccharide biosynthesis protein n=1 Tax=Acinetobacter haemolyticus TaxID=29430 RepID=UPI003F56CF13
MNASIKFKSDIFRYAFVQILSKGLTLLSTYIIAYLSSDEIFGYIALLQASFVTVITIFGFNLQSGIVRFYFNHTLNKIASATFPITFSLFLFSIISSIVLYFILKSYPEYKFFSILPFIGFLSGFGYIISMLGRSNKKFHIYAFSELCRPFLLVLLVFLFYFLKLDVVKGYIIVLLFSSIFVSFYGFLNYNKLINKDIEEVGDLLSTKIIFLYTAPLFFVQLMSLVNNVSDKYILKLYLDIEAVGLYGKAYLLGSSLGLLFDSLMLLWVPYTIKHRDIILKSYYNKIVKVVFILIFSSIMVLLLALFVVNYKLAFWGFNQVLISTALIVVSAFVVRIGYQIVTPILNAFDKTLFVAKISTVSMILGLIFNFLLIPYIGIYAAALSTFLSFFIYTIFSVLSLGKTKRHYG